MAYLPNVQQRLTSKLPNRLDAPSRQEAERARSVERSETIDFHGWYKKKRWQSLREQVLIRDRFICQRTGVMLTGKHPAPDSGVVHHIEAHLGDPVKFWNPDNLEAVSKAWHDSVAQAMEHADKRASMHPDWLKPSIIPLTIVCGPPASGKTTYVKSQAGPNDLVIDLDAIASELSGKQGHDWNRDAYLNAAIYRRNDMLGSLSRQSSYDAAWLIVAEARAEHRKWWNNTIKPQQIIVLETSEAQCIANAEADGRNDKRTRDGIVKWWFEYSKRRGDTAIQPGGGSIGTGSNPKENRADT